MNKPIKMIFLFLEISFPTGRDRKYKINKYINKLTTSCQTERGKCFEEK